MKVEIEEVAMLLGAKLIEIHYLQKQIVALQKQVADLTPKPEAETVVP